MKLRPYIWESASKPMFVKSIYLETEGYHRVLLDREPHPPKRSLRSNIRRVCSERSLFVPDDNQLLCVGVSEGLSVPRDLLPRKNTLRPPPKKPLEKSNVSFVSLRHQLKKQEKKGGFKGQNEEPHYEPEPPSSREVRRPEGDKNHLTERVLQWLDKSGNGVMVKDREQTFLDDVEELVKKSAELDRRRKSAPLRRSESVHHLHLTFNDEDHVPDPYAGRCKSAAVDSFNRPLLKKSVSLNSTTRKPSASQQFIAQTAPSNNAASSLVITLNNLDLDAESDAKSDSSTIKRVTGGGGATQRKPNRKVLKRKDTLIENQYKHLIQKHILERCNTQQLKRQIHIFIPKLKKPPLEAPSIAATSTCQPSQSEGQSLECESASCVSEVE